MSDIKSMCKEVADRYGYPAQSNQLVEECAELIQAINKYRRYGNEQALENYIEEIADVEVMLEQIKHLVGITEEQLDEIKTYKLRKVLSKGD